MSVVNLGEDFDWFAVDQTGAAALFATAGAGFVPPVVVEYHVMQETVAGSIEYPNWGTDAIWEDAAALGLFVFDWSDEEKAYRLAATPQTPLDPALQTMISRITHLPVLTQDLSQLKSVADLNAFEPYP